jgi:hypothetical protein
MRKHGNAVGFLPRTAIETLIEQGSLRICHENDDSAGYIISRPFLKSQPRLRSITQAAVAMDAQRRHHGLALLAEIERESIERGLLALQACCAVGLDSNAFWAAAGFKPIVHMTPENMRGREVICWRKALTTTVPSWFAHPPQYAGWNGARVKSKRNTERNPDALSFAQRFLTPALANERSRTSHGRNHA